MAQSLAKVLVHLIFSTKNRDPLIHRDIRSALHAYLTGTLQKLQCPSLQTGGTADHVHTLLSLARTRTIAAVIEELKKSSSKWMKQHGDRNFTWQAGYGACSGGESQAHTGIRYIAEQERHHQRLSFQEEFRRFLDRYGVAYDERYVWD